MPSERVQRQIDRLLDEAEAAIAASEWNRVRDRAINVLALDPENADALTFLAAADRATGLIGTADSLPEEQRQLSVEQPTSFVNGRYEVRRFLGEGGKKRVYLAYDTTLDRDVAFALIKTEGLDEAGRQRVTREAQAMGRLGNHPNIVSVYDIGDEPSTGSGGTPGAPYLVLPLLPGGDVENLIEKAEDHKLPIEQAIKIAAETANGLAFAHGKGLVHRDIKPGNTWLAEDGRAMIGDFGLAVAADRSRLTQAGMMVGTVNYMPPEQAMGGEITPKSDLYSLGAMLYEMVCGRPPFVGDESVAIIGQHLNTPPVAPTWHRPDCPPALETLILRLLEKDPGRRPASAAEVREALLSVESRPSTSSGRTGSDSVRGEPVEPQGPGDNPFYRRTFVGRENEVKQLQAAFDAALSGQGGLVMVVGEPGIGKTAICEQLATYAALRGGKALVGHCYEEGSLSLPYLAFVEAMRSYVLNREPDGLKSDLGTGAADVARIVSEVRDRVGVELRAAGDPEDDRYRLLQAVSTFIKNASTVQPLLIVLEDLHWADRGTLDLLLHVARNLAGTRLLIVGTYRDVEVDRAHPLSGVMAELRRIEGFQRIPLRGLTIDEVQRMMSAIRGQEVPANRAEQLHRQTEGNPLFIQEVLRYMVEEGITVRRDGRYALADPDSYEESIPEGLRDVIGKRLSRLSAETNRVLSVAAVIGRDFNLSAVRMVVGVDEEPLLSALEEAVRIGVLEERSEIAGGVNYRFAHAFFRQTLYEELSAARRIRLHQQVGHALEELYASRVSDHAAELAEHFSNSSDHDDLALAVKYGEAAAQRAMSVFDYGEAVRLLDKTIDVQEVLAPDDKAKRCDLLLALGEALIPAGEPLRAVEQAAEIGFALAREVNDQGRAFSACQLATDALFRYGAAAVNFSEQFRQWAQRKDDAAPKGTQARVLADLSLASLAMAVGEPSEALRLRRGALALARQIDDQLLLFQVADTLIGQYGTADQEASELALEFSSRPRQGVGNNLLASLLWNSGIVMLRAADRTRAEEMFEEAGALTRISRNASLLLFPLRTSAMRCLLDGSLEEAIAASSEVVVLGNELGRTVAAGQYAMQAAWRPFVLLGRFEQASEIVLGQISNAGFFGHLLRAVTFCHLGRTEEAVNALAQGLAIVNSYRSASSEWLGLALEAAVLTKNRAAVELLIPMAIKVATGVPLFLAQTSLARHLGDASALLGKPNEAREYYNQAREVCAKVRFRPELALTRLGLAELLLEHYPDERGAAIEHLDFAIGEFREMKMQPSLERALSHRGLLKA